MHHWPVEYRGHHFLSSLLRERPVVIDLGAHRGEFAALMQRDFSAEGVSLEANPDLAAILPQVPGFHFFNAAASGSDGELAFHLDPDNAESSTIQRGAADGRTVWVPAMSFSSIMQKTGVIQVDLVKMDIESAELDLIAQTPLEVLRQAGQWTIEFHDFIRAGERPAVLKCLERLREAGFSVFRFCLTGHKDILAVRSDLLQTHAVSPKLLHLAARFCAWRRMVLSRVLRQTTGR